MSATPTHADAAEANGAQPKQFRRIAVFCGSSAGNRPEYVQIAEALGAEMVKRNLGLVYGGGTHPCLQALQCTYPCTVNATTSCALTRRKRRADGCNCKTGA